MAQPAPTSPQVGQQDSSSVIMASSTHSANSAPESSQRPGSATAATTTGEQAPTLATQEAPRPTANAMRRPCTPMTTFFSNHDTDRSHSSSPVRYAIDTEMVTVIGPGELPARRAMVSVGIVNDRLETLLYGRVAVPKGCKVVDGAFARVEGGLWASWDEGIPASCASDFLARHASAGGVVIGWELHGDLEVIGFDKECVLYVNSFLDFDFEKMLPLAAPASQAACRVRSGDRERLPLDVVVAPVIGRSCTTPPPPSSVSPPNGHGPIGSRECTGVNDGGGCGRHATDDVGSVAPPVPLPSEGHGVGLGAGTERSAPGRVTGEKESCVVGERETRVGIQGEMREQERGVLTEGKERTCPRECVGEVGSGGESSEDGDATMQVVEVTDLFRTMKGLKCTLGEAYACCFDRPNEGTHNAGTDARMTMELYNLWRRAGEPPPPLGLPLSFFVVNFHSFKPGKSRHATLWGVLRPERGGGRQVAMERDSGTNTYKLSFRTQRERDAYLAVVENRMAAAGLQWDETREFVRGKKGAGDGYQLSCGVFKMHVLEHER